VERVREGPSHPHRRLLVELPAARAKPEHRRADRPAHEDGQGGPDGVRRRRPAVARRPPRDPCMNLAERTLELVRVQSPTGDTAAAAELYAGWLRDAGMDVELERDAFPATPTVVGRLFGSRPGPRVVLNGHLDTVPIPHDPPRIDGDRIYGRGAADMKGALVAALAAAERLGERPPERSPPVGGADRKSTPLNSSHRPISYAVFQ